jgi:hypothetical protein
VERHNIEDIIDSNEKDNKKVSRKSMKLNEKMLKKASVTIDLIRQKVKSSSNQQVSDTINASFITSVSEITQEAL